MPPTRLNEPAPADGGAHHWLGVDTGGTFTDFFHLSPDGEVRTHKVLSTPDRPERAILQGVADLGLTETPLQLVHGSTVATNAVLEGKGARVALVTNRGFGDLLTLARQNREELYELSPAPVEPPVPEALCFETGGRRDANGEEIDPLTDDDIEQVRAAVRDSDPEAVAVVFLFSWLKGDSEQRLVDALAADEGSIEGTEGTERFITHSAEVLPRYGEYERGMATWLNAYVGPRMYGYLQRLEAALPHARITVMQSSGERVDAARASRLAVRLLLSGPAGGLVGGGFVGQGAGPLLSFDMGGTSTDVAVIDGAPALTTEGRIGPYPVSVPMVDMHTIGAGGGSLAWIDAGGALQVGPESAGADPGPACYGRGGTKATVTDAHVVLGRIPDPSALEGLAPRALEPDVAAARQALADLGGDAGLSATEAAQGVLDLATEHMARALRVMTVERGLDPQTFTLLPFGGAGGLHVCALADALGMSRALVPVHAGVLSALGMLAAPRGRQLVRSMTRLLLPGVEAELRQALEELEVTGRRALREEGVADDEQAAHWFVEMRYRGQAFSIDLPWVGGAPDAEAFHTAHAQRYGHRLERDVEVVNLRVEVLGPRPPLALPEMSAGSGAAFPRVAVAGEAESVPVFERDALTIDARVPGPLIVVDPVSTTWVAAGWSVQRDAPGNLHLVRADAL